MGHKNVSYVCSMLKYKVEILPFSLHSSNTHTVGVKIITMSEKQGAINKYAIGFKH